MTNYDIVVLGGGPGGYVSAIRSAQLGNKTAIIDHDRLGGICLNWGCIPTKALLKNAEILHYVKNSSQFGINISKFNIDFTQTVKRSREVSHRLSKGIEFLIKKNKIKHIDGTGVLKSKSEISVLKGDKKQKIKAKKIIIATGGRPKFIPGIEFDKKNIISSKEAMILENIPKRLVIIGAGAIGVEFAHLYNAFGSEVTLVEGLDFIVPNEDSDISKELENIFNKRGINIITSAKVDKVVKLKNKSKVYINGTDPLEADKVLMAVGVSANTENLSLEEVGVELENGFIKVNGYMQTSTDNIYAIGDVCGPPLLAHVASFEGTLAAEHISGHNVDLMNYENIPACTYCDPEIASVGLTEIQAKEKGYDIKVGKFPFSALGKALADGDRNGFVKIIYDSKYGELLGCHIIGKNATNLITELSVARNLETTYSEILKTIHPHPTLSEAIQEATADAFNEAIHK